MYVVQEHQVGWVNTASIAQGHEGDTALSRVYNPGTCDVALVVLMNVLNCLINNHWRFLLLPE